MTTRLKNLKFLRHHTKAMKAKNKREMVNHGIAHMLTTTRKRITKTSKISVSIQFFTLGISLTLVFFV